MTQTEISVFSLTDSKNRGFGAVTDAFRAFKSDETWLNKDGSKAPPDVPQHESTIRLSLTGTSHFLL